MDFFRKIGLKKVFIDLKKDDASPTPEKNNQTKEHCYDSFDSD
jgi:hypothetical protein